MHSDCFESKKWFGYKTKVLVDILLSVSTISISLVRCFMSRQNKKPEVRVSNPFGAPASNVPGPSPFGTFGQSSGFGFGGASPQAPSGNLFSTQPSSSSNISAFGTFGQPAATSTFSSFGQPATSVPSPFGSFGQPANASITPAFGALGQSGASAFGSFGQPTKQDQSGMQGDSSPKNRVSNPFANGSSELTTSEAINQYKTEFRKKHGYPFSCFGAPSKPSVLPGDISPFELRWHLANPTEPGSDQIMQLIAKRSQELGEDFTEFLRAGLPSGTSSIIHRSGPYVIPDSKYPAFVPRDTFSIPTEEPQSSLSEDDLALYRSKQLSDNSILPLLPPPIEFRYANTLSVH